MPPYEEQERPGLHPVPAVLPRSYDSLAQQGEHTTSLPVLAQ